MTVRRKLLVATATVGVVGALIAGANADDAKDPSTPAPVATYGGSSGGSYGDAQLHQDYNMTQYMGNPNADGPMFSGQTTDPQLQHSQNPGFVRELEQHQADMDRMLGKGAP